MEGGSGGGGNGVKRYEDINTKCSDLKGEGRWVGGLKVGAKRYKDINAKCSDLKGEGVGRTKEVGGHTFFFFFFF